MTPENQQSRLEKIRALLAKAESTHFPEEAKVFAAKAQELMAKWSIDEMMLGASRGDDAAASIDQTFIWLDANEYRAPKVQVLNAAASANDCKLLLFRQQYVEHEGKRKRRFQVAIIGTEADRRFVEILYTSLILQIEQELISDSVFATMELECDQGGHRIRWRNGFVNAYAATIRHRLQQAKERAKAQSGHAPSTLAMVLVGKLAIVDRRMHELYPSMGKGSKSSAGTGLGSSNYLGREAGQRADVGNPKVTAQNRKRIE